MSELFKFRVERFPARIIAAHGARAAMPEQRYQIRRALLQSMPFEVWATVEERENYASPCDCRRVYRIGAVSTEWLRKRELLRRGFAVLPCVCPCMGRVVEDKP